MAGWDVLAITTGMHSLFSCVTPLIPTGADVRKIRDVDFLNNTTTDIWALFIDLSSVGPTSDLLGGVPLLPGESIVVNLPGGTYDIIALDAGNNVVCDYYNVQISGYVLWDCN